MINGQHDRYVKCHHLDLVEEYSMWNDAEVDTPILVRDNEGVRWKRRHFAKYENGSVYAFSDGRTSWSKLEKVPIEWKYAKLAE